MGTLPDRPDDVSQLLSGLERGDKGALDSVLPLVYDELQDIARGVFAGAIPALTLQPTALVHEAWLKLAGNVEGLNGRQHFFVLAAKAMRQIIADYAKGRRRDKRGGQLERVTLSTGIAEQANRSVDLVELDDTLRKIAEVNPRQAEVAELRLFGGLTLEEVGLALGVSKRTAEGDWAIAKAYLRRDLG